MVTNALRGKLAHYVNIVAKRLSDFSSWMDEIEVFNTDSLKNVREHTAIKSRHGTDQGAAGSNTIP